jgi:hypothetical protein
MRGFETQERVTMRQMAQRGDDSGLRHMSALTLESATTLSTNCVLIGHFDKADVVWTRAEFLTLCEHMLNGNSQTDFLFAYRDKDNRPKFVKAKTAKANRYAPWSWDTIRGRAKHKVAIGFYPSNTGGKSRWAAARGGNLSGP